MPIAVRQCVSWLLQRGLIILLLAVLMAPAAVARPTILTSIHPLALIAHEVAGDQANIEVLVPVGASPHTYSMRPSERRLLDSADVFLWVGPEMETFLSRVIKQPDIASREFALGKGLLSGHDHHHHGDHKHGHGHDSQTVVKKTSDHDGDPHLWLDPELVAVMAKRLVNHLSKHPKFDGDQLNHRLERFHSELKAHSEALYEQLTPARELSLFTYHDAFRRFADRFDLNMAGTLTINPERRPGARRLAQLREHLEAAESPCVMTEPQFSQNWWDGLVSDTGLRVSVWDPLGQSVEPAEGSYLAFLDELGNSLLGCFENGD